ncbi:MAG TPA: glycoside hydrolase family 19 protein [Pyrinomonadaceae bacterium]|nr:glycoside hydrolase family 19 protein [Pyrinomonadaceae bacterium]
MITLSQFKKLFPACPDRKAALYLPLLVASMRESGIVTRLRAAAYFAQLGHESLDFKYMEEIASGAAYEGRRDLGNLKPGDGRRFKGRGPIQTTGRLNYTRAAIALDLPLTEQPELLSTPEHGFRASAFFWKSNNLNSLADALSGRGDARDLARFDKTTRRVNGGYNGRVDRQRRYLVALKVLDDAQFAEARLGHTLDSLTAPQAAPATPQGPAATEAPPQAPQAPAAATQAPAPEPSLLDEIPVNDETKAVGAGIARKLGLRAGGGIVTLWTMGLGGKVFLIAALLGAVGLVYFYRHEVRAALVRALRKVKGGRSSRSVSSRGSSAEASSRASGAR